jgi:alkanesulfonate monooxygenase SsuD/methylene tetrahydromethanopterin reductase-like flavin-dependent oxidoreductase (luciferase family)
MRLEPKGRSAARSAFDEGGRYLGIPRNGTFSELTSVQETGCGTKGHLATLDEDVTVDAIKRALIIAGSPRRVLDQLVALREETGHFGTLLMGGHDWDQPQLWRRSMELLATEVMSKFARHAAAIRPR